jgi:phosphatidylglycerophosphate synthase
VLRVRSGPTVGLAAQAALLAMVAVTTGLGVVGWITGAVFGLSLYALIPQPRLGPADRVTLIRAMLVGCVTALVADAFTRPVPARPLVAIAVVALVLDAIDGKVARRTGTSSASGARFDMEVDAFLILVLSVHVARSLGVWVLAIGSMRYAYAAAGWALPWLRGWLPPRYWRKVVAAVQGIVLTVAASGLLPRAVTVAGVAVALALLVESFGRDVVWQWLFRDGVHIPGAAEWAEAVKELDQAGRV